ncbi:hypothetical protein [Vibrio algarum]|uniref:TVP38/TMEM64 family protein n=1 Tax=Vibrio algarum TaxID=3020714 RepID=A0ABT4YRQ2_9VIBR|nr:hypothetical protein [Vibrio sp. KJ40-1]MDB1124219.1 hypothetical protein [Vibrio sp. KJ40-1]
MTSHLKLLIWLGIVVTAILGMNWLNNTYSIDEMQEGIETYQWYFLTVYALIISLRGLLFIPTMPIILMMASAIEPWLLFLVTLTMSCVSSYLVCLAIDYLDMQKRINALPGKAIKRAQHWINTMGIPAIAGWAFFPLVFTELIVYLARLAGLARKQIILAVAVGEGLLISVLIFVTDWVTNLIQ